MDLPYIVTGRKKREALNKTGKYRYYKNHFTLGEKDQPHQKNIKKKEQTFNLSFKYKWLTDHPWHVYSKKLSDALGKACVLLNKCTTSCEIFVKVFSKTLANPRR